VEGVDNFSIYKKSDKIDCSNYTGLSLLSTMYKILSNVLQSTLTPLLGTINVDFDAAVQQNILRKEIL